MSKNMVAMLWMRIYHTRGIPGAACLSVAGASQHPALGRLLSLWHVLWKQTSCSASLYIPRAAAPEFVALALVSGAVVQVLSFRIFLWRGGTASRWLVVRSRYL